MIFPLLSLVLLISLPGVLCQNFLGNLVQALNTSGLTQLANITSNLNSTAAGQRILNALPQGNWTVFAPDNSALQAVPQSTTQNLTLLADIVSYHAVSGNFTNETATWPNVTIGRTLLNDSSLVALEGNKSQVLVWSKLSNGTTIVLNNGTNVTVTNMSAFQNIEIIVIDKVLTPPGNFGAVLAANNLTSLATLLASNQVPSSVLQGLSTAKGVTVFAPNNDAINAANGTLGLMNNQTALADLIANHVINGSTVYSSSLASGSNYTSAAGEPLDFVTNSSGTYVSSNGSNTVKVVQSNLLTENGVVHVIDGVMVDTQADPAAASSA
ncbi:FAS1 domain-containing protein [Hygrophoropsis aurantiaca]|uniref:FAS1 domain-containing protein n=1 Tax=Hygrophoropsis aurantiaca TaxID=72124 RepID=A0ACB8A4K7_9AGAM|nr:FAS1 domain-containing protein [Hygrophoropsis aurantiaca]